jgi:hypothetical protein
MFQRLYLALSICALAFVFGGQMTQAGWSDAGLTVMRETSSLVIAVKKNKHHDDDNGLEQCTIQSSGSGGGCKGGFKWVCQKMKNGNKCCGCVVDKNAKPMNQPSGQPGRFTCKDGGGLSVSSDAKNASEARANFDAYAKAHDLTPKGPVNCSPGG